MAESKYLLEMKGISKSFPSVNALVDVDLNVRPGTVHALLGENGAGKSTLMKCLFGTYKKDAGVILIDGAEQNFRNVHEALTSGISMVHQELEQVPERNVMDNVWLGRYPKKNVVVDEKKMYADTKAIFEELGLNIDPKASLKKLTVSQRQMIDIAKAVSYQCRIVVMDEPTSSLVDREVEQLFKMLAYLKGRGVGIIYISHKLDEIYRIADDVSIMRDGHMIETRNIKDITMDEVVSLMVGRTISDRFPPKDNQAGDVILKVDKLTEDAPRSIKDVSFDLREGEVLGIAGLLGSGRTELLETMFGIRPIKSGTIIHREKVLNNKSSQDAIRSGFALCTEERRFNGIFADLPVSFNSVIINLKKCKNKLWFLSGRRIKEDTSWVIDALNVKTPNQTNPIRSLSGGNQQKLIIGKWLLTDPDVMLMDDPTRGIDVGAKYEIYQLILDFAKKGKGVIFASSEMPELLGISDRILVLSNGRVSEMFDLKNDPEGVTQERIFKAAAKYL